MLRYLFLAMLGVLVIGAMNLRADDSKKPKAPEKAELKKSVADKKPATKQKQAEKGKPKEAVKSDKLIKGEKSPGNQKKLPEKKIIKDGAKQPVKSIEKKSSKEISVGVLGRATEYYTTSPAQGHPADGKLNAGTKVRVIEKAGSYVRVVAQIEAFVPVDSLSVTEQRKEHKKGVVKKSVDKSVPNKEALLKKQAAEKEKSTRVKGKPDTTKKPTTKIPQEKQEKTDK